MDFVIVINTSFMQQEFKRIEQGLPATRIDTTRYNVEKPDPSLEKDVQVLI